MNNNNNINNNNNNKNNNNTKNNLSQVFKSGLNLICFEINSVPQFNVRMQMLHPRCSIFGLQGLREIA